MFDPPKRIEAEVFARLPDSLRLDSRQSDWLDMQMQGAAAGWPTHSFLEGPSFDHAGNLYCVDIPFGRIFRISPDGVFDVVADYDGNPNGLKIHRDGRIFIADNRHGIMLLDTESGAVEPYFQRPVLESLKGVNDLFFAANGDLYFTDMGQTGLQDATGKVYRLMPDGSHDIVLANVPGPNGLVMNLNETALFLAVTRLNCIWVCPLLRDGMPTKVGTFLYLQGGMGPDGLALDQAGNLAVAHVGFGAVWIFSPRGEPLYRIDPPEGFLTSNLAFGGPNNRSLYITESQTGTILKADLDISGKPMYSHM